MNAIATLAWHKVRTQLLGLLVVGVLGGMGLGFAMSAVAGARRADTAYARLRDESLAPDALFDAEQLDEADLGRIAALPEVVGVARFSYTPIAPEPLVPAQSAGALVGLDTDFLSRVYRPVVVSGRLPDPDAGDEVVVNEALARAAHLEPFDTVQLSSGFDQPSPIGSATVVGVVRGIFDVGANAGNASMLLSSAFLDAHRSSVQFDPQAPVVVRLVHASDLPDFVRDLSGIAGHDVPVLGGGDEAQPIERTVAVQTVGLIILAVIAGLATVAVVAQALSRALDRGLADLPVLAAIGLRPRQRLVLGSAIVLPVALVAAVVATVVTALASPLLPTGFARTVDPLSGVQLDLVVVLGSTLAWVLAVGAIGLLLAWRKDGRARRPAISGRTRRLLRPLPVRIRLGGEAALTPVRDAGGAASRAALVTAALAVTVLVGVATFAASLDRLLDSDELQGWSFDATIQDPDTGLASFRDSLRQLSDDPAVAEVAWVSIVDVEIAGRVTEAYAFDPDGGGVHPTMRAGRPPLADGEVVLGADLLRATGLSIGDVATVGGESERTALEIVGSATYPELGESADLGSAASLTQATAIRLGAPAHGAAALIRLAPGRTAEALDGYRWAGEIVTPFRPPRVRNLEQVGRLPSVLAGFVALLGIFAVGHGIWASIRARRRDFVVLTSLGFRRRDLGATLFAQLGCIALIGAVGGLAAGIAIGTQAWSSVAGGTAVVDRPVVPALQLILTIAGSVGVMGLIGLVATVAIGGSHPDPRRDHGNRSHASIG